MATMAEAGIPGVGTGILMPRLQHRFRVQFSGIGGGAQGNDLAIQCVTASLPNLSFDEVQLDRYNSRAYVAGKHTWDPCTLSIESDITNKAESIISSQLEAQQRLIGASGPWLNSEATASSYKFGTTISILDGNEGVVAMWKLEGCYIASCEFGQVDFASSDKVMINLSLRYDNARQELFSSVEGSALGGLLL